MIIDVWGPKFVKINGKKEISLSEALSIYKTSTRYIILLVLVLLVILFLLNRE